MSKSFEICPKSQKKNKKMFETLKGSYLGHTGRTFFLRNVFPVPYSKKRFCKKNRNLQSFVLNLRVSYKSFIYSYFIQYETLKVSFFLTKPFLLYGTERRFRRKKVLPVCPREEPFKVSQIFYSFFETLATFGSFSTSTELFLRFGRIPFFQSAYKSNKNRFLIPFFGAGFRMKTLF